jgi:hypothetical protein
MVLEGTDRYDDYNQDPWHPRPMYQNPPKLFPALQLAHPQPNEQVTTLIIGVSG